MALQHLPHTVCSYDVPILRLITDALAGPPEFFTNDLASAQVTRPLDTASDMWSFGTVLSEAAVWLTQGYGRLDDYRNARKREIQSESPESNFVYAFHVNRTVRQLPPYVPYCPLLTKVSCSNVSIRSIRGCRLESMSTQSTLRSLSSLRCWRSSPSTELQRDNFSQRSTKCQQTTTTYRLILLMRVRNWMDP